MRNRGISVKPGQPDAVIIAGLALLSLLAGILMMWFVSGRIPQIADETAYLFQARVFARGQLSAPDVDLDTYDTPFVMAVHGHRIGTFSIGWPLVLSIGEVAGADTGWLVPPVLNALTTILVYLVGRELFDRQVGVIAALLATTSPFTLIQTATLMSHVASAWWGALAIYALLRVESGLRQGSPPASQRWSAVGGVALGMMVITRSYTALAFALPCAAGVAISLRGQRADLRAVVRAYWPLALAGALTSSLWPLWLALVTGSPTTNTYLLYWPSNKVGFGPDIGPTGHTIIQGLIDARDGLLHWFSDLYGWPGLSWVPLALGLVFGPRVMKPGGRVWLFVFAAIFISLVVFYLAYWTQGFQIGPRFYYEAHLGLAILAAAGLRESVWRAAVKLPGRVTTRLGYAIPMALIAANLVLYLPGRLDRLRHQAEWFSRAEIDQLEVMAGGRPALVIVASGQWRDYGPMWSLDTPWYDGPIVVAHDVGEHNINTLRRYPGRQLIYVQDGKLIRVSAPP